MKKEILIHLASLVLFFSFFSFINNWLTLDYWQFWLGGMVGTLLPDIDHLIYVYLLRPQELTSQRVNYAVNKGEVLRGFEILYLTRSERKNLILHTILFQIVFFVLTFWVLASTSSIFGSGIVLAFLIHQFIDQYIDVRQTGGIANWFKYLPFFQESVINKDQSRLYIVVCFFAILLLGIFM